MVWAGFINPQRKEVIIRFYLENVGSE